MYVGYTTKFNTRWNCHRSELKKNIHGNSHLQNAWNEYGESAFKFERIEVCEIVDLKRREHYWCQLLNVHDRNIGYNIEPTSEQDCIERSEETKKKLSIANTGKKASEETRRKISQANKGKKLSAETIQKMIKYRVGIKRDPKIGKKIGDVQRGRKRSPEAIKNMRNSFGRPVIMLSQKGEYIKEYETLSDAEKDTGATRGNIFQVLRGNKKSAKGYIFIYKELYDPQKDYSISRKYGAYLQYPIIMCDMNDTPIQEFSSCAEAVLYLKSIGYTKSVTSGISSAISGKLKYYQKLKWKRKYEIW